jgi:AcrR family transcriptional regulator
MKATRAYRMSARADAAAETGRRIVSAAYELFLALDYDDVTLQAVAERAGVTLQTVLRRFSSKEGLVTAIREVVGPEIERTRAVEKPGDIPEAVRRLVESYEAIGPMNWRMLQLEQRIPVIREALETGRKLHRAWIEDVFAEYLPRRGKERERGVLRLYAATDFYQWKLYRVDFGLPAAELERLMRAQVEAIARDMAVAEKGRGKK